MPREPSCRSGRCCNNSRTSAVSKYHEEKDKWAKAERATWTTKPHPAIVLNPASALPQAQFPCASHVSTKISSQLSWFGSTRTNLGLRQLGGAGAVPNAAASMLARPPLRARVTRHVRAYSSKSMTWGLTPLRGFTADACIPCSRYDAERSLRRWAYSRMFIVLSRNGLLKTATTTTSCSQMLSECSSAEQQCHELVKRSQTQGDHHTRRVSTNPGPLEGLPELLQLGLGEAHMNTLSSCDRNSGNTTTKNC